jgi:hypothetical protein
MILRPLFPPLAFCVFMAAPAAADVLYSFSVDTSSISGTAGSLDFNFNPGPFTSQFAQADILNFATDGALSGSPALLGDVSGVLPSTVTFDNGSALNDYFQGFTFGSSLMFDVRLYGPAVNSPDGVSASGSAFAFSMFSDTAGTQPVLTTDTTDGFAATLQVNLDGSTTLTNSSSQTTVSLAQAAVPEPVGLPILAFVFAAFAAALHQKTRRG